MWEEGGVSGLAYDAWQTVICGHQRGERRAVAAGDGGAWPPDREACPGCRLSPQRPIHRYGPCR
jgi:hypothetical protein